eukprot:Plantae.Rhodophyta-Purpureofilum_apyrenoidigerum.ctg25191.p2 GENE.Plantae.Rhodophyta-Purpureofilum_apyrenoidigerum.ctg25191~~Plantae.Rhodophyta-Purpureofilum_apyrenoidigerum.ctg25191.p2  ORF type:complete len:139 (-),score=24.66 Plantae.Rhodophyta-Purpureofilum_apyrenoidigerum.ctg25191:531-947(-)
MVGLQMLRAAQRAAAGPEVSLGGAVRRRWISSGRTCGKGEVPGDLSLKASTVPVQQETRGGDATVRENKTFSDLLAEEQARLQEQQLFELALKGLKNGMDPKKFRNEEAIAGTEINGCGYEPTRYGDWASLKGRCSDF